MCLNAWQEASHILFLYQMFCLYVFVERKCECIVQFLPFVSRVFVDSVFGQMQQARLEICRRLVRPVRDLCKGKGQWRHLCVGT